MDLVNADRAPMPLSFRALRHPLVVAPLVAFEIVNHRRGLLAVLTEKPKRIALQEERAGHRLDLILVVRAFLHARDENFPDAASDQFPHRMDAAIPEIEIADHADASGIRRPNRKVSAAFAPDLAQMRAKLIVKPLVISLGEKVQIHLAHDRAVTVGIAQQLLGTVESDHFHEIGKVTRLVRHGRLVKSFDVQPLRRKNPGQIVCRHDLNLLRFRSKNADDQIIARAMRTEDVEWISMGTVEKGSDLARIDRVDGK